MFFANFDYRKLRAYTYQLPIVVLVLLALVQFTPLGLTVNEAKRWLVLGPIQFQPSELAKPAIVLMLHHYLVKTQYFLMIKRFQLTLFWCSSFINIQTAEPFYDNTFDPYFCSTLLYGRRLA